MIYLLLSVLCVSSINIGFATVKHHDMDNLNVTLFNYLAAAVVGSILLYNASISWQGMSISAAFANLRGNITTDGSFSFSIIFGVAVGFLYICSLFLTQQSIKNNGTSLTTMFQRTGIIIPIMTAVILWSEFPTYLQAIGIVIAVFSLIFMNFDGGSLKINALLLIVFLTSGICELSNKVYQMYSLEQYKPLFLFAIFATCVVLCFVCIISRKKHQRFTLKEALLGLAIGIPNIFSAYFIIKALEYLPTGIVFPVLSVSAILLITLVSALAFGEKISKKNKIAIAIIIVSLVLVNI